MSTYERKLQQLGGNIKRIRVSANLTQERLAELCEYDPTYISLLERGKRNPPFKTLLLIADKLGCDITDITGLE